MVLKYLIGSKLLNLKNPKDTDYLILSNHSEKLIQNGEEYFIRDRKIFDKILFFQEDPTLTKLSNYTLMLSNYQMDYRIIKQNFPIHYNILEHKKELIHFLDFIIIKKKFNFSYDFKQDVVHKRLYHFAYNLFILQNNNVELTKEQFNIVQKIHDGEMPISYLDEMKSLLEEIKKREAL